MWLSVQEVPRVNPCSPQDLFHRQGGIAIGERCKGQVGEHNSENEEASCTVEGRNEQPRRAGIPVHGERKSLDDSA